MRRAFEDGSRGDLSARAYLKDPAGGRQFIMDTYHPGDRKRCRTVIWEDGTISFGLSVLPKHSQVELWAALATPTIQWRNEPRTQECCSLGKSAAQKPFDRNGAQADESGNSANG